MPANDRDAAARAVPHDRPVDLVHLARQTFGNLDLESEVLDLFERQSALLVARLGSATDERTWRDCAHTLKGSALGIGAGRVAAAAGAVESLAKMRASREASAAVDQLVAAVQEANAFIRGLNQRH